MTLLVCLFVIALVTVVLLGILNTGTSQLTAARHSSDYEKALYLAGAGVHHALAELEADSSWTTGISNTPSSGTEYYSATVAAGSGSQVVVTGVGTAGSVVRSLDVPVDFGG